MRTELTRNERRFWALVSILCGCLGVVCVSTDLTYLHAIGYLIGFVSGATLGMVTR